MPNVTNNAINSFWLLFGDCSGGKGAKRLKLPLGKFSIHRCAIRHAHLIKEDVLWIKGGGAVVGG
jgi:hypothetical protein